MLSYHACLHQNKVFTVNLSTKELAERDSDDVRGRRRQMSSKGESRVREDENRRSEGQSITKTLRIFLVILRTVLKEVVILPSL